MATTAYTIRSHYNPNDREKLERETGQIPDETEEQLDSAELWQLEVSRVPQSLRPKRPPPYFVPAARKYDAWDEWGSGNASSSTSSGAQNSDPAGSSLAVWYRSLNRARDCDTKEEEKPPYSLIESTSSSEPQAAPIPRVTPKRKDRNTWFIAKAIESQPTPSPCTPAPTLADILARDPPPLPSEKQYTPPVWLEIGPSNRGFNMLQRKGWNEGEPLGPDVIRRRPVRDLIPDSDMIPVDRKGKGKAGPVRREIREVKSKQFDDVSELCTVEVIDLTLSDEDEESTNSDLKIVDGLEELQPKLEEEPESLDDSIHNHNQSSDNSAHGRKALLTPIATVLKSDRLGIGLKAKTAGPYKASKKRVTHNAAALAAHIRAAEESRKVKREFGHGRRRFERQRKKEETNRKLLLAYLNS